jgi:hypothetical protein
VWEVYEPESVENPQKAFDAIVSDFALTCGSLSIAAAASRGFASPIYAFLNQCECRVVDMGVESFSAPIPASILLKDISAKCDAF